MTGKDQNNKPWTGALTVKLAKYTNAGVREYWMIDPMKHKIIVYDLEHEELPVVYGMEDKIPVKVWNGECVIDFAELLRDVQFLEE